MTPLSAQQTVDRAKAALQSGAAAGLPELLSLLESLSTDYLKVNLDELSALIEKDGAVMAKVIAAANTLAHNPTIATVATIKQAIHLVGFQRIRSLAISLMLLENTGGARNSEEQRAAAAEALCAGMFAQSCAEQLGTVDPDIAFAAAALRHFGYILFPAVSLPHTREVTERLKTKPHDIAYRGMFGVTPLELSRRVLAGARLPDEVAASLRDFDPEKPGGIVSKLETRLTCVVDFGSRLARISLAPTGPNETFLGQARLTARKFERLMPDACDMVEPALLRTDESLQAFLQNSGGTVTIPSLSRIRQHVSGVVPPTEATAVAPTGATTEAGAPVVTTAADAVVAEVATTVTPPTAPEVIAAPIARPAEPAAPAVPTPPDLPAQSWEDDLKKSGAFAAESNRPTEVPLASVLSLARDASQAEECWLFQRLDGGASFSLVGGTGQHWTPLQTTAALRPEDRNVFGVCLTRKEVVVLHDTTDTTIARYLPEWWRNANHMPHAFALIPVTCPQKGLVGLALVGWHKARQVAVSGPQVSLVQQICLQATTSPNGKDASRAA